MEKLWLYGIVMMVVAAFVLILCVTIFFISDKKIKRKLEEEYGNPKKYNC